MIVRLHFQINYLCYVVAIIFPEILGTLSFLNLMELYIYAEKYFFLVRWIFANDSASNTTQKNLILDFEVKNVDI